MRFLLGHFADTLATFTGISALLIIAYLQWKRPAINSDPIRRRLLIFSVLGACSIMMAGLGLRSARVARYFSGNFSTIVSAVALTIVIAAVASLILIAILRIIPAPRSHYSPARRGFLLAARAAVLAAPAAITGYAVFIQRSDLSVREIAVPIPGLAKEHDGLRIVQVSDIHLSPFLSERELARAVDMANECRPHLHLVTGDLITSSSDPLDRCIAQLARLKSDAGSLGCLGNHEIYARAEDYVALNGKKRAGIDFLRGEARVLTFGGKPLNFAGVDYQRMGSNYLIGAEKLIQPGMTNILLSHNPDVFPVAARQGFDLTISGHTHGGQITVEFLHQNLSVARFFTHYVSGLYREGNRSVYVTRGIGTVGIPARLGAPPEVTLIRLCAT
jgi:uncharacterized protein